MSSEKISWDYVQTENLSSRNGDKKYVSIFIPGNVAESIIQNNKKSPL